MSRKNSYKGVRKPLAPDPVERNEMLGKIADELQIDAKGKKFNSRIGRWEIPLETIIMLRRKNLTMSQIAKVLGCSGNNIQQRLMKVAHDIRRVEDFKKVRADVMAIKGMKILDAMTDEDLKKAKLRDKAVAYGVLYDKERLERGKSTSNVAYADILKLRREKEEELRRLESGDGRDA